MPTDTGPTAPDPAKQGGLKDEKAKPAVPDDSGEADIETEEDAHGSEGGGMIGEG
jgi:hypothetical protein